MAYKGLEYLENLLMTVFHDEGFHIEDVIASAFNRGENIVLFIEFMGV